MNTAIAGHKANIYGLFWSDPKGKRFTALADLVSVPLGRQINPTKENNLWLAVLLQAIRDAYNKPQKHVLTELQIEDARRFLSTNRLNTICDALEIEPEYVRELIDNVVSLGTIKGAA